MSTDTNRRLFLGLSVTAFAGLFAFMTRGKSADAATFEVQHSPLLNEHRKGVFDCAGCALPLFSSAAKYDSGTGWPSFKSALPNAVSRSSGGFGMFGIEEHCRRCGGHLGHVFSDGPPPLGTRHCINGLALTFRPA
jgi:peptide-methionine (R)-S-oxide reductase